MKKFKGLRKHNTKHYSDKVNFVIRIAQNLHHYGIPSHRLEDSMNRLCSKIDVDIDFLVHSGVIFASIQEKENQQNLILKPKSAEVDLNKLPKLDALTLKVIKKEISIKLALKELDKIETENSDYSKTLNLFAFTLSSASAALVFKGSWEQIIIAGIIGFFCGVLILLTSKVSSIGRVLSLSCAIMASSIAIIGQNYLGDYSIDIPILTGLIVLIPGFSFTVAMTELASGHNVSGTSRFANSIITFLMLSFGIALGSRIFNPENHVGKLIGHLPHENFTYVAMLIIPIGFTILFKAKLKQYIWIFLSCAVAYYSMIYGKLLLGNELGLFIAALCLGMSSNLFARIINKPAVLMLVPGTMLLVPGSVGFRSLTSMMNHNTLEGMEMAISMIIIVISLVSGFILSNVILPAKRPY